MKIKHTLAVSIALAAFLVPTTTTVVNNTQHVEAARTDMVDVSSYNGLMTVSNYTDMRNNYGVKAVTVKLTEGTYYKQPYAVADLANAKTAGLYINGYYYCKYTNVASAKAEAQYACDYAKQVGLPVTSVIAMDIEDANQRGLSEDENSACINAAFQVIEANGYRPDVYSMASWGDVHIPWSKIKWIAQYPYVIKGDKYTRGNGWQFSSTQHFNGSYGNFDVTQLYTDYYTANQNKNAVISNADTAHVDVNHGKQINQTKSTTNNANKQNNLVEDYTQNGWFTTNTTLNVRTAPNTNATITGQYHAGKSLTYNHVYIQNGLVWLRFNAYSGVRYIAAGVMGGTSYGTRTTNIASYYTVRSGDTLGSIARRYDVSVSYLCNRNGISNPNYIYPGEHLVI